MTINFWKGLFENLGTRLNFSSAYHPQTDGQSEIANLTVLDLLKAYVMEVDQRSQWEKYLPLVEYAYKNTVHTSIGKAPFEVIEGRSKSPLLLKVHGKIFVADEYSRDLKESFQKIKEAISIARQKQKAAANKHRRALAFKENDWVLLKFPNARLRHTTGKNPTGHQKYYAKLAKRYYGPFQILKPINEMAYQLRLPNHWLIHNAFHVSLLKPYKGEPSKVAIMEDPPKVEGQEEVLQPESVLRHEDKVLRNDEIIRRYLIKFKNYPFKDAKWMQGTQFKDSLHLVNAYNDSLEYCIHEGNSHASYHSMERSVEHRIEALVKSLPVVKYAVKDEEGKQMTKECAVCLCEFESGEMLRLLPACDHLFHKDCIDMWLFSNTTCPLCRLSLLKPKKGSNGTSAHQLPESVDLQPMLGSSHTPMVVTTSAWLCQQQVQPPNKP
ncbi:hypothetical protein L7F22_003337 [Adiantum nelumboides]|nr:hypothetical protein [Adiantum nelumboides]